MAIKFNGGFLPFAPTTKLTLTNLPPTYVTFYVTPDTVNEDGVTNVTMVVTTDSMPNGTQVGYTLSGPGVAAIDTSLGSLTGTLTIVNNTASVNFTATADFTTEGTETVTITLDAVDSAGYDTGSLSDDLIIADTSISTYPSGTYLGYYSAGSNADVSVAIQGDVVVVGTMRNRTVKILDFNTKAVTRTITNSPQYFGSDVALNTDYLAVSSFSYGTSFHVYRRSDWAVQYTDTHSSGSGAVIKGGRVRFDDQNDHIVAHAWEWNSGGIFARIRIHNLDTNSLVRQITAPGQSSSGWGTTFDITGDYLVVAAPTWDNGAGVANGRIFVYSVSTGALLHQFSIDRNCSNVSCYNNKAVFTSRITSNTVYVYDLATLSIERSYNAGIDPESYGQRGWLYGNYYLITGNNVQARVTDIRNGALIRTFGPHFPTSMVSSSYGENVCMYQDRVLICNSGGLNDVPVVLFYD